VSATDNAVIPEGYPPSGASENKQRAVALAAQHGHPPLRHRGATRASFIAWTDDVQSPDR
jgi:hypothetical protein